MSEQSPKPLNKTEVWVADHAVPIFSAIAVLILLGAAAVFFTYEKQSGTADTVHVLEPQVTRISKSTCDRRSLNHPQRAQRCAERIRIGLVNCRASSACRSALLAAVSTPSTRPPRPAKPSRLTRADTESSRGDRATSKPSEPGGGDALQPPSNHGHQQPGATPAPSEEATHEPPAAQSPSPAPAPPRGETPESPAETPPAAPEPAPTPPKVSAPAVEVCVLEHTCVGVEVGLGGLLPKGSE